MIKGSTGYKVSANTEEAFRYLTQFFSLLNVEGQKGIILQRHGVTIAAALYVEYNGANVYIHLAGDPGSHWLNREFLYWVFHYPFIQLGVKRMTSCVDSGNVASIRFTEHLGATREATLAKAGKDGSDVYVYRMFREDCKYV